VRKIIQSKKNIKAHDRVDIKSHDQVNTVSYQKRPNTTDSSSDLDFKKRKSDDSAINAEKSNVLRSIIENEEVSSSSPASTLKRNKIPIASSRLNLKSSLNISVNTEMRITVMVAIITLVSMVSFIPYYVSMLLDSENMSGKGFGLSVGKAILRRSFMLNSAINPFVMAICNASFRRFISMSVL
jgi:hypothetical protein